MSTMCCPLFAAKAIGGQGYRGQGYRGQGYRGQGYRGPRLSKIVLHAARARPELPPRVLPGASTTATPERCRCGACALALGKTRQNPVWTCELASQARPLNDGRRQSPGTTEPTLVSTHVKYGLRFCTPSSPEPA